MRVRPALLVVVTFAALILFGLLRFLNPVIIEAEEQARERAAKSATA